MVFAMKLSILLGALLLSASPVVAQYNADDDCVVNKAIEIQRLESELQKDVKVTQEPGFVNSFGDRMIYFGHLPKDVSASAKKERALWFIEGSINAKQYHIDALKLSPDCSTVQGGKAQ